MKNLILTAALFMSLTGFANGSHPEKAVTTFNTVFKNATGVVWNRTNDFDFVNFTLNGVKSRAVIDKSGALRCTFRYYGEELLPAHVLYELRSSYKNKTVHGVTEVADKNGINYSVILKDAGYYYTVVINNDLACSVIKKIKRADR